MPPIIRITKENIVRTAVEIVRNDGAGALNARSLAAKLNCSTQPVFSNFATMEDLKKAVIDAANDVYRGFTEREVASGRYPEYKASGMAYIRFAKEEKELFKLLFMRDRSDENEAEKSGFAADISKMVQSSTGFSYDKARLFHLEMWAYVHGIAVMMATDYLELDFELISEMLTDAYRGIRKRYEEKE